MTLGSCRCGSPLIWEDAFFQEEKICSLLEKCPGASQLSDKNRTALQAVIWEEADRRLWSGVDRSVGPPWPWGIDNGSKGKTTFPELKNQYQGSFTLSQAEMAAAQRGEYLRDEVLFDGLMRIEE